MSNIPLINRELMEAAFGRAIPSNGDAKVTLTFAALSTLLDRARAEGVQCAEEAHARKSPKAGFEDIFARPHKSNPFGSFGGFRK